MAYYIDDVVCKSMNSLILRLMNENGFMEGNFSIRGDRKYIFVSDYDGLNGVKYHYETDEDDRGEVDGFVRCGMVYYTRRPETDLFYITAKFNVKRGTHHCFLQDKE